MKMKLFRMALLLVAVFSVSASAFAADAVRVVNAWTKATVPGQKVAGVYMEILSPMEGSLTGVSFHLARSAEIHSMKMEGGTMKMRPVKSVELPAGKWVKLQPGGLHVMLFDLERPLRAGQKLPMTLTVEFPGQRKREVTVQMTVLNSDADAQAGEHEHH